MLEVKDRAISRVLETARRKLLETGTRNRLIHVNRSNQRANCLNVVEGEPDVLHRLLRSEARRLGFKALGLDKQDSGDDVSLAQPEEATSR